MHYSNIILLAVSLLNLGLSFFVIARNKKSKMNIFFAITIFGIALWCVGIAFFRMANIDTVYLWGQFVYFAINFTTIFFLYFTFFFPGGDFPKNKLIKFFLFLVPIFIFVISVIPRSIISSASINDGKIDVEVGWGYYVHSTLTILFFVWAFFNVISKFIKSTGINRLQIWYLLLGTGISTLIGIVTNVILFFYTTEYNWIGPSGTIIMVVFITYAITRYRLMDIRLIILRSAVFGLIVFITASIFSVISTLIALLFTDLAGVKSSVISSVVIVVLLTIFYSSLRKFIEKITNSFLYKKSYNPDTLLAEITRVTSSILDLNHLLSTICKILDSAFSAQNIGVALLHNGGQLEVTYQQGFQKGVAEGLVSYPDVVNILHKEVKRLDGILVIDEMRTRHENGEFEPVSIELLDALHNNDVAIILPLYVKEQMIGIIEIGNKKSGDPYNSQDLKTLRIIAGQAAVAIENAKLYEEMKDFNVKLADEVERKTAQLRKANLELRQLDQAKSEFISIASHQLRTPLTVIKGYISMMREGNFGEVPKPIMKNLEKVYSSNERLIHLVENLLDISRIESGRQEFDWKKINLEDTVKIVVDNLKQNAKAKDLKLIFDKSKKKTPQVVADPNKIHEVIMNFVDNAIKYTKKGEIDVSLVHNPKDNLITFCVKDTGRGIDPTIKKGLFKKFSRGKGSFRVHTEGVGLGLYVAKMIIDSHKGKIWAESKGRDKGAKFCFSLSTTTKIEDLKKALPKKKFGKKVESKKK